MDFSLFYEVIIYDGHMMPIHVMNMPGKGTVND